MNRAFLFLLFLAVSTVHAQQRIPDPLKTWEDWATWDDPHRHCPSAFNSADKLFHYCPSELSLQAGAQGGRFSIETTVFETAWFVLPGDSDLWPLNVQDSGKPVAVVERGGRPAVRLSAGVHLIAGDYRWAELPQKIRIPLEYGILSLSVEGRPSPFPNWDTEGFLWLKQTRTDAGDKDFLDVQVYRLIEDGIPMWLHTILELSVSGKSREVELGNILPEGWSISSVESPIPVAVDDDGKARAQVRAGKWQIHMRAFRTTHSEDFKMKDGAPSIVEKELVGFKADPELRMLDVRNATPVDATQTTFPEMWRAWPVYQWNTKAALTLVEKMRGSGLQSPKSMSGARELWLNETGRGYTYQDHLAGQMQSIWRLDVAPSLQLGSVKVNGEGQLITRDPKTRAAGVEIRSRNIRLDAVGTSATMRAIPATGWDAGLDSLTLTLNLPPGWRLFALFGADTVEGDWLTSWTLLDLFLLLIFSLAIYRIWGIGPGVIAFLAFGLTYHEPESPRYAWFVLLMPLALLKVIPEGKMRKVISVWKYAAFVYLLLVLVPFTYRQVQSVIYPQLELERGGRVVTSLGQRDGFNASPQPGAATAASAPDQQDDEGSMQRQSSGESYGRGSGFLGINMSGKGGKPRMQSNMRYEAKARIQTGPGVPEWHWRYAVCRWHSPVSSSQNITPILIPPLVRRILTLAGLALVFWLIAKLLEIKRASIPWNRGRSSAALMIGLCFFLGGSRASAQEIPDKETLETLKLRLLKPSDSYPHGAEIPSVNLQIREDRISFEAQIDAAIQVVVPLPGKLPAWSPVRVQLDGKPNAAVRREDGYLWVVVPEGVHHVKVEGMLPGTSEWEWSFLLKPRTVRLDAPGWNVTGLKPDGTPESQIFFARKQTGGEKRDATYDRREFHTLAVVDRVLEIGLTWQIHNTVTRLSAPGKAISLKIPLLDGEQVLSSGVTPTERNVEVSLASNQASFSWDSELPIVPEIKLTTSKADRWVERWHLISSPVWNISLAGLSPVMEAQDDRLVPVWHPWPGESVTLGITRPEAVNGPTMTIHRVHHEVELGQRNRNTSLRLTLQCSVSDDLVVGIDPSAEITSVKRGETKIPVRREGGKLVVPVQPGMQDIVIDWKETTPLGFHTSLGRLELPVESSNITTILRPPANRWILWAHGPLQGPAVRFWSVLVCGLIAAWVLGGLPLSPLSRKQWTLLMVGLTQITLFSALIVVGWLFLLAYRGTEAASRVTRFRFNVRQILIVVATVISLGIFLEVVRAGLLGNPRMFILGNGSNPHSLDWFAPQSSTQLPRPGMISVSVWFYRFLMLLWALWLAHSLIRWLAWGWKQFNANGEWYRLLKPPPIPS